MNLKSERMIRSQVKRNENIWLLNCYVLSMGEV